MPRTQNQFESHCARFYRVSCEPNGNRLICRTG
jgi:hypothetical protein